MSVKIKSSLKEKLMKKEEEERESVEHLLYPSILLTNVLEQLPFTLPTDMLQLHLMMVNYQ